MKPKNHISKKDKFLRLILIYLFFILSLNIVLAEEIVNIEIYVPDHFHEEENIYFTYKIFNINNSQIIVKRGIDCPFLKDYSNSLQILEISTKKVLIENYEGLYIDKNIKSQSCTAYVQILAPIQKFVSKDFKIITNPSFSLDINFCKNSICSEKSKVFVRNQNIYLDYLSEVEDLLITSYLIYPDKTTKRVNLPTSIKAEQIGTYKLEVGASKDGFKTKTLSSYFGVIEKPAELREVVICNKNNICEPEKGENIINCPEDCSFSDNAGNSWFLALFAMIAVSAAAIILYFRRKKEIKPSVAFED